MQKKISVFMRRSILLRLYRGPLLFSIAFVSWPSSKNEVVMRWLWPASPSPLSLFPSLLLGVPLLFVIPWGIVKYLYEDEG